MRYRWQQAATAQHGDRPSFPSPPACALTTIDSSFASDAQYDAGALAAREFLRTMQNEPRLHAGRLFDAPAFRLQWLAHLDGRNEGCRTGYADAMCAFIQVTLEGASVNVESRDVLGYLRECRAH